MPHALTFCPQNRGKAKVLYADAVGSPSPSGSIGDDGMLVILCSDASNSPGNPVTYFNTDNPLTAGFYSYTPVLYYGSTTLTNVALSADTYHWLLIAPDGGEDTYDYYQWAYTGTTTAISSDGWTITGNTAIGQAGIPIFPSTPRQSHPCRNPQPLRWLFQPCCSELCGKRLVTTSLLTDF